MKLSVVGIGPGGADYILPLAARVLGEADVVIGYKFYLQFVQHLLRPGCEIVGNAMMEEEERARLAVAACAPDRHIVVVSSGDAGIYAMAALIYEHVASLGAQGESIELQTIPGVGVVPALASRFSAPLEGSFTVSDGSPLDTVIRIKATRPRKLAGELRERGFEEFVLGRMLCTPEEEIIRGTLPEKSDYFSVLLARRRRR